MVLGERVSYISRTTPPVSWGGVCFIRWEMLLIVSEDRILLPGGHFCHSYTRTFTTYHVRESYSNTRGRYMIIPGRLSLLRFPSPAHLPSFLFHLSSHQPYRQDKSFPWVFPCLLPVIICHITSCPLSLLTTSSFNPLLLSRALLFPFTLHFQPPAPSPRLMFCPSPHVSISHPSHLTLSILPAPHHQPQYTLPSSPATIAKLNDGFSMQSFQALR